MPLAKLEAAASNASVMASSGTKPEVLSWANCKQADGKKIHMRLPTARPAVPSKQVSNDLVE
ncbi:hypothetical protein LTR17_027838, partial [Elasticomyces elasticus]